MNHDSTERKNNNPELAKKGSCQRWGKRIAEGQEGIIAFVISFVLEMKGLTKGGLWRCLSFSYKYESM